MFQLTEELIRSKTGASSFSRGRDYLAEGRLYDAIDKSSGTCEARRTEDLRS